MEKRIKVLLVVGIVVSLVGLVYFLSCDKDDDVVIGGERDEYGCLGAAGYGWNESELACVREWVFGEGRLQVVNFRTCVDAGYPIMESYPRQCRAPNGDLFIE